MKINWGLLLASSSNKSHYNVDRTLRALWLGKSYVLSQFTTWLRLLCLLNNLRLGTEKFAVLGEFYFRHLFWNAISSKQWQIMGFFFNVLSHYLKYQDIENRVKNMKPNQMSIGSCTNRSRLTQMGNVKLMSINSAVHAVYKRNSTRIGRIVNNLCGVDASVLGIIIFCINSCKTSAQSDSKCSWFIIFRRSQHCWIRWVNLWIPRLRVD